MTQRFRRVFLSRKEWFLAFASVGAMALGADVVTYAFPNADGSGDLASAAAWNNAMPDMTSADVAVKITPGVPSAPPVYTISSDMTLAPLTIGGGADGDKAMLDLTTESPTVTMAGNITVENKRNAEFKGGLWNFDGKYRLNPGYQTYGNHEVVLSQGCVWTNVAAGCLVYNYSHGYDNNYLRVTESSRIHFASGDLKLCEYGTCTNVVLDVSSGGSVYVNGKLIFGRGSGLNTAQKLLCRGAGSKFVSGRYDVGCNGAKNNLIEASDGGFIHFNSGTPYFTYSDDEGGLAATGNVVRAIGPGSTIVMGAVYFGRNKNAKDGNGVVTNWVGSSDNRVEAFDGALVSNTLYYVRGVENGFVVSNATIATTANGINCQDDGTNCYVRFQGNCPRFIQHKPASGNFTIRNGFRLIYDLPEDGYVEGCTPLQSFLWGTMAADTKLEINGIDRVQRRMRAQKIGKRVFTLAQFVNGCTGLDNVLIAEWQKLLPEGAELTSANPLKLTITTQVGTMVIVR